MLRDNASRNGTFVMVDSDWVSVTKVKIAQSSLLKFGSLEIMVDDLLVRANPAHGRSTLVSNVATSSLSGGSSTRPHMNRPRRNPTTGEIEEE